MFSRSDKLWLIALPVYVLVLIFRHEAGHALSAVLYDGAQVTSFAVLPGFSAEGGFIRPHVRASGATSLLTRLAPYLLDVVVFSILYPACKYAVKMRRWIWLNVVVFAMFMPLLNAVGNYGTGLWRARSDVGVLLAEGPAVLVHLYFTATIVLFAYGSYDVLRSRKVADTSP